MVVTAALKVVPWPVVLPLTPVTVNVLSGVFDPTALLTVTAPLPLETVIALLVPVALSRVLLKVTAALAVVRVAVLMRVMAEP